MSCGSGGPAKVRPVLDKVQAKVNYGLDKTLVYEG
jgi:hypothetical protein